MSCLLWLSHKMKYSLVVCHIKIKIGFHAPCMCMRRHGVPYASLLQYSEAHYQLTTGYTFCMYIFINGSAVGGCPLAYGCRHGLFFSKLFIGIALMRRRR